MKKHRLKQGQDIFLETWAEKLEQIALYHREDCTLCVRTRYMNTNIRVLQQEPCSLLTTEDVQIAKSLVESIAEYCQNALFDLQCSREVVMNASNENPTPQEEYIEKSFFTHLLNGFVMCFK